MSAESERMAEVRAWNFAVFSRRMPPWGLVCPMSAKEARVLGARSMATQACGLGDAKDKSGLAQNLQRVGILVPVGHAISSMERWKLSGTAKHWDSETQKLWRCHNKSQSRQVVEVKDADAWNRGLRIEAGETTASCIFYPFWPRFWPFGHWIMPSSFRFFFLFFFRERCENVSAFTFFFTPFCHGFFSLAYFPLKIIFFCRHFSFWSFLLLFFYIFFAFFFLGLYLTFAASRKFSMANGVEARSLLTWKFHSAKIWISQPKKIRRKIGEVEKWKRAKALSKKKKDKEIIHLFVNGSALDFLALFFALNWARDTPTFRYIC